MINLLFTTKHWQKPAKVTILNLLKYCTIKAKRHEFCFMVTVEKDFKQKVWINKEYPMASFFVSNIGSVKALESKYFSLYSINSNSILFQTYF